MIYIDDILMPSPQSLEVTCTDTLGSRYVNAEGGIVRDVLGVKKRITVRYKHLKPGDALKIAENVSAVENMQVICPDISGKMTVKCRLASMQYQVAQVEDEEATRLDCLIVFEEV